MASPNRSRTLPQDFPHPARSSGVDTFCAVLDVGRTSIFRFVQKGLIPPPVKVGNHSVWPETLMAKIAAEGTRRPADAALA